VTGNVLAPLQLPPCPPGQTRNPQGQCVAPCPPGLVRNVQGQCVPSNQALQPSPPLLCPPGQTPTPQGCIVTAILNLPLNCPPGQAKNAAGQCEPCPDAPSQGAGGSSIGAPIPGAPGPADCDLLKSSAGSSDPLPTEVPMCPPGQILNASQNKCLACPPPAGLSLSEQLVANSECVAAQTAAAAGACGPGGFVSAFSGMCQCLPYYTKTPQGTCIPAEPAANACGPGGFIHPASGQCFCWLGYKLTPTGVCAPN
jgi:hypothetical protein